MLSIFLSKIEPKIIHKYLLSPETQMAKVVEVFNLSTVFFYREYTVP
jgi:hypothetical protein